MYSSRSLSFFFTQGLIKIRGDRCWRELTCMHHHYETQPVPNPLSYYLHQTPDWAHRTEVFINHIIELGVPFLLIMPGSRLLVVLGGIVQILFMVSTFFVQQKSHTSSHRA